jgi:hypothetical protein
MVGISMDNAPDNEDYSERFWSKVVKYKEQGACWPWIGSRFVRGYGRFSLSGKIVQAHRVAYVLTHGPIPAGLGILHRCDNPPCVNPDHLFVGTPKDNAYDRGVRGRHPRGERSPVSKLTQAQVNEIRMTYVKAYGKNGQVTQTELGERFGVHNATISRIVRRKKWTQ